MNLQHLKYFVDAAYLGGISQSARVNDITQSAVSRGIKNLELDLEADLIAHKQNRFQLTEVGIAVFEQGQSLFSSVNDLRNIVSSYQTKFQGPIKFACQQEIASHIVGPLFNKLEKKNPQIDIQMKLGENKDMEVMLEQNIIDFALIFADNNLNKKFKHSHFLSNSLIVVKSPKLKEAKLSTHLMTTDITKGQVSYQYLQTYKKLFKTELKPKLIVSSWQVVMDLAISGLGYALIPEFMCHAHLKSKKLEIVENKIKPLDLDLQIVMKKNKTLPESAKYLQNSIEL